MAESQNQEHPAAGEILKQVRESKGIALETVHAATKIPMDALKAIEEGYTVRMLSPFYIKGFIKMYAQYLGVDITQVREDYHKEKLPQHIKQTDTVGNIEKKINQVFTRERQKIIVQLIAFAVVLFFVTKIAGCVKGAGRASVRQQVKTATGTTAKTVTPGTTNLPLVKTRPVDSIKPPIVKKSTPKVPGQTPAKKAEPSPVAVPQEKANSTDEENAETSTEKGAKNVRLTVKAAKSGWLQVKVDGNVVFQSTIKEGIAETWEGAKTIELSGKDIHNLEFEVNGKVLGTLGRADRNARRVIVTKEGLTVKE